MGDYDFGETNVSGASFGHVELAAWFDAVAEQCDNANCPSSSNPQVFSKPNSRIPPV